MICLRCRKYFQKNVMKRTYCSECSIPYSRIYFDLCKSCFEDWDVHKKFTFLEIPEFTDHLERHSPVDIV